MSPRAASIVFRGIGIVAVVFGVFGLLYNGSSFAAFVAGALDKTVSTDPMQHYLPHAFLVLSALCVVAYICLVICGAQFCRLRTEWLPVFIIALVIEAILYFGTHRLWGHPTYGMSIAAATGISEGGLVPQFLIAFPLWAAFLAWASARALRKHEP